MNSCLSYELERFLQRFLRLRHFFFFLPPLLESPAVLAAGKPTEK
jgi:hypothetical protein